nr:MAG TPA: hypothetical protein [Caudoviricetes sp.]
MDNRCSLIKGFQNLNYTIEPKSILFSRTRC